MHAKASVQVNADPVKTLECAYDTLISMKVPQKSLTGPNNIDHIDKKLLFVSMSGRFTTPKPSFSSFICLITVKKLNDCSCELTIIAELNLLDSANSTHAIALISDFLERFSQKLYS